MKVSFWMEDVARSTALAIGSVPATIDAAACPFNVGDTIAFTESPPVTYQVAGRHYQHSEDASQSQWLLELRALAAGRG